MVAEYYTGGGGMIQVQAGVRLPWPPRPRTYVLPLPSPGVFLCARPPPHPHTPAAPRRPAASPGLIDATGAPRARGFVNGAGNLGARWITYLLLIN